MADKKFWDTWNLDKLAGDDGPTDADYFFGATKEALPGGTRTDIGMSMEQVAFRVRDFGFENAALALSSIDTTYTISETPSLWTGWTASTVHGNALSPDTGTGLITILEDGEYLLQTSITMVPSNLDPGEYIGMQVRTSGGSQVSWNKVQVPFELAAGDFAPTSISNNSTNMGFSNAVASGLSAGDQVGVEFWRFNRTGSVASWIAYSSLYVQKIDP